MEPQGAAGNAGPGRSNKLRLCESDRGNKIQETRSSRKHPLESFEKTNWKCKSPQTEGGETAKPSRTHERRKQQREASEEAARVVFNSGTASPIDAEELSARSDGAASTQCQLTWKATNTSGCFPAPGTSLSMYLQKIAQGPRSSVTVN